MRSDKSSRSLLLLLLCAAVQVRDLAGKSYRLLKDNLDKDIVPAESKFTVKKVST
jgi:hypothetical protein